jgi:hypothetical protein
VKHTLKGSADLPVHDFLRGKWTVSRVIPGQARLEGTARFETRDDDTIAYVETGTMRLKSGGEFEANRGYVFEETAAGFRVYFDEEPLRLFHEVSFEPQGNSLKADCLHRCGADLYRSRYKLLSGGRMCITHKVNGPRKDYIMSTYYRRSQIVR